jgi:hypothetical protein
MQLVEKDLVTSYQTSAYPSERDVERCALAVEILRGTGRLRLQVHGESMLPTLWPRDVVEIEACLVDEVRPGEIVLAVSEGRFFLHRFIRHLTPSGFSTRGDSMPACDPEFPNHALLGRLVACRHRRRKGESTRVHSVGRLSPWSWAAGKLLCYCGPARSLALRTHVRWGGDRRRRLRDLPAPSQNNSVIAADQEAHDCNS